MKYNFLPEQYEKTETLPINHNYLPSQFENPDPILEDIRTLVSVGDFTLGKAVDEAEQKFAQLCETKYALGVGSGTDAIFLSLKALGIDKGDEVITVAYTFYATIGAIVTAGATPVFVDIGEDYNLDPTKLEAAITPRTKAIVPVHWSGLICDMPAIRQIAEKYGLSVVEDACHAIGASRNGQKPGHYSETACYSMHPLKNLNVWGDGGFITTNSRTLFKKLSLLRNHGLVNRDICEVFAYNSRLDTLQAIVAKHMLLKIDQITEARIKNALFFDRALKAIPGITVPHRHPDTKQVFHIYVVRATDRDNLVNFLISRGIDAKIHYPTPMHLQPAAKAFGYKQGDFPVSEEFCRTVFSLPVHEFISEENCEVVIDAIKEFKSS